MFNDREPTVYLFEPQILFVPVLERVVARAGGAVVRVGSAIDLEEFMGLRGDFILADIDYTDMSATNALAYLRAGAPSMDLIVLTDTSDPALEAACLSAGAMAVIKKSLNEFELSAELRKLWARHPTRNAR